MLKWATALIATIWPVLVSINCVVIRTRLPPFRTEPSSTYRTPSSRPTCFTSTGLPLVPGLLVATVVWVTIDIDKPDFSLLRDFDVTGMLLMATFLGCLQYALQQGPRSDWLDDNTIPAAVALSAAGGG